MSGPTGGGGKSTHISSIYSNIDLFIDTFHNTSEPIIII
jgi:hypothetical protein